MKQVLFIILAMCSVFTGCNNKEQDSHQYRPIDKDATTATVKLYNQLFSLMDKGIMLGHQDDLAYGHGWYKQPGRSDVKDVLGDYPAVVGWELGHVEIGAQYNLDSVFFSDMKQYIKDTYKRGGITTLSWHGDNIATGNTSWDCAQDTVVRSILPGGVHHEQYLIWLGRVGDFFLDLKDEKGELIPVVFRMYHEHTGNWFWWCKEQCTPDEYKKLWIMTVEYLRDTKQVHNLLYAYSPAALGNGESEFLERYPGDDYVDIVGYDSYAMGTDSIAASKYKDEMTKSLQIVTNYAAKAKKLPIIGETGMEAIPDTTYYTETVYPIINHYKIAWILFWRNAWESDKPNHYYTPFKGHKSANDFQKFADKENILLLKDIQSKEN